MLIIDFNDNKIDIKNKISTSLNLTLTTIINLNIINQLLEFREIKFLPDGEMGEFLTFSNINSNFYYSDSLEQKYNINSNDLFEFLELSLENKKTSPENDAMLEACKDSILENFITEYGYTTASDFGILDVYSRDIELLEEDYAEVIEILEILQDKPNQLKKHNIVLSSFSRTLCSYLDSLSREYLGAIFSNSHYFICKLIRDKKDFLKITNDKTGSIITSSILGKKLKNTIVDFYGLSETENANLHEIYAPKIAELERVIESRNEIMHRFKPHKQHYNTILYKWEIFGKFFNEIHEEYNNENRVGTDFLLSNCIDIMKKISYDHNYVSKKLIPIHTEQYDI
ncbi:TPA: hypothetical protein RQO18_004695 [Klebsiella oxytoca]|uniref:hypothetical protein n=1 Tax=Klebsiella pneumoniae TaxID=573 RepID=UPI000C7C90D8|nr:hypothetical protein [Klebsiella pneumoniae]PLJ72259.1 hypothetical protein B6J69_08785 [Klebsiella pneumoniae]HDX8877638.1 hypothetical protein [Klebsiella oxytoca]